VIAATDALVGMRRQVVSGEELTRLTQGRPVTAREAGSNAALVDESGALVAVAEREGDWWQPRVVISDA
jgi:hypothetical protein